MDEFLTTSKAAQFLGVCEATVRRLHRRGDLEAYRDHFGYRRFHIENLSQLKIRRGTIVPESEDVIKRRDIK